MIITKVSVQNYRSFGTSDNMLRINRGVTTIVGMNGSGKSNLVEIIGKSDLSTGINGGNQLGPYRNKINQAPISLRFTLEALPDEDVRIVGTEPTTITLGENSAFELSGGAKNALESAFASYGIYDAFSKGKYETSAGRETILEDIRNLANFSNTPLATYRERLNVAIKRLTHLTEEMRSEASAYLEKLLLQINKLIDLIPIIYFQKDVRTLKDRYTLSEVRPFSADNKEGIDNKPNDLLLSLLKVAQIDRAALESIIANQSSSARESFERNANRKIEENITRKFKERYKRNSEDLRLELRIESNGVNIHVSVSDVVTGFSERSNGLRWYLNMFIDMMARIENSKRPVVYVLDEPGIFLHVNAQNELKTMFQEQAAGGSQIIYTTHSPYMIDSKYAALRAITKLGDSEFSSIHNSVHSQVFHEGKALDTLTPIAAALGMDLKYGFAPSQDKLNVVTEGITDQIYLLTMAQYLQEDLDGICITPSTGANNVKHLCSILMGWGFRFLALFDFDAEGRRCANELCKDLNLSIGTTITFLKDITPHDYQKVSSIDADDAVMIERLIAETDRNAFNIDLFAQKDQKKIAALKFSDAVLIDGNTVSEETENNFRALFSRLKAFK